ncbi:hypothetical protein Hypma_003797 [Hypsizygus marmoreus]|uniref:Oxidoreductase-like domain-containing protein n=1 Tax=Hypsizygus marmoreus TaxID=39966 RepID=A0A369K1Z0_HYPMA|nr:hypothetical protein Hypma_003797 [Hypsizygus marmoreus]
MLSYRAQRLLHLRPIYPGIARNFTQKRSIRPALRGGQNLTERYRRLEKSSRERVELVKEIDDLSASGVAPKIAVAPQAHTETFRGFEIPKEPWPPEDDECCMSNCAICTYDLYEESLDAYRNSVDTLRTSLSALNIPESEWPPNIRPKEKEANTQNNSGRKEAILSAFEEMERQLMKKHQGQTGSGVPDADGLIQYASNTRLVDSPRPRSALDWQGQSAELYHALQWILFSNR